MTFESIILNRMNTGSANYMDAGFKGAQSAFTACSEDIGADAATAQGLWSFSARSKKHARG